MVACASAWYQQGLTAPLTCSRHQLCMLQPGLAVSRLLVQQPTAGFRPAPHLKCSLCHRNLCCSQLQCVRHLHASHAAVDAVVCATVLAQHSCSMRGMRSRRSPAQLLALCWPPSLLQPWPVLPPEQGLAPVWPAAAAAAAGHRAGCLHYLLLWSPQKQASCVNTSAGVTTSAAVQPAASGRWGSEKPLKSFLPQLHSRAAHNSKKLRLPRQQRSYLSAC